jgi:acetyl esterase/lipase
MLFKNLVLSARLRRAGLFAMALLALTGCAKVDILNALIPTGGISVTHDVAYGEGPRRKLDIYVPKTIGVPKTVGANAPVIVFFYGGTWQTGTKDDYLFAAQALASTGTIVVVPDYRVYPEVTFPGFLDDGAAAVAWTLHNIAAYGGDTRSVFLAGHSAGAYISIMLTLNRTYLAKQGMPDAKLAGGIGMSGPYDFLPLTRNDVKPIFEVVPDMAVTQPITYARADAPPLLLLHGDDDVTVGPYNTRNLANRMRALGGNVDDKYYPGVDHIDMVISLTALFRDRDTALADIAAFVAKNKVR